MDGIGNGDISEFPKEMFDFFNYPSKRKLVTPAMLTESLGRDTFRLDNCDIYVMGKRTGCRDPVFWTKLRIINREFERNVLQGFLGVQFMSGYGFNRCNCDNSIRLMRPTDIGKMVTEDVSVFKKRAVVNLNGTFISLEHAESFCDLPLMTSLDVSSNKRDNKVNGRKRKAYAKKQEISNKWAHISRESMEKEQKKSLHKMLLPYKKNLGMEVYFAEFMKDVLKNCELLKKEFKCEDDLSGYVDKHIVDQETVATTDELRKVPELELDDSLINISMSSVMW